jgi:hypothetical protein
MNGFWARSHATESCAVVAFLLSASSVMRSTKSRCRLLDLRGAVQQFAAERNAQELSIRYVSGDLNLEAVPVTGEARCLCPGSENLRQRTRMSYRRCRPGGAYARQRLGSGLASRSNAQFARTPAAIAQSGRSGLIEAVNTSASSMSAKTKLLGLHPTFEPFDSKWRAEADEHNDRGQIRNRYGGL